MKTFISKSPSIVALGFCLILSGFLYGQKSEFIALDTVKMVFQPVIQSCLKAKKIYVESSVEVDSAYRQILVSKLDPSMYSIVSSKSEADLVLVYSTTFGARLNTQNGIVINSASQSTAIANPAYNKPNVRHVPTSRETPADHNFDSKKTAYQNSRSQYKKTPSRAKYESNYTPKSIAYSEVTNVLTKIVLYDAMGEFIDEVAVTEQLEVTGHSSISYEVAKKDYYLSLENQKPEVRKFHLETAMNSLVSKFLFNSKGVPVFGITVKNKQFGDWNDAINALNAWVNTPNRTLDDPRVSILGKIIEQQANRDYGSFKDSAGLSSAALHNWAVYQYYMGQPVNAGSILTKAQSNLAYTDESQHLFYENLIILLFRGI